MSKNKGMKEAFNVHHIIGQMNHSRANVDLETNKMIISVLKHRALNTLVNENQEPQSQLGVMYNKIRQPVLSEQACREIEYILSMPREDFYRTELLKSWKKKK